MAATRRRKAAAEPEPAETEDAFEELEDDEDDLEELGDDEEESAPVKAKRGAKKAAPKKVEDESVEEVYNTAWLAEHVTEMTGDNHDSRSIRMLLRKMAKNDELARVVGEDRTRYVFPRGPNDPIVRLVVKKVKAGELKAVQQEGLERVKKTAKKTTPRAAAPESETAPPAKRSGRKAAAKAATKAAPTTKRRRAAATAE